MRRWQRWAAVATGLAVLVAIPSLIAARPVHGSRASADSLLSRVRASTATAYSGLVETHGSLSLPNLPSSGDLAALLSSTTRLRAWWVSSDHFRVDELATDGEADTTVTGLLTQQWDSSRDRLVSSYGTTALRTPRASDLLPPDLAERLVPADLEAVATRLPAVRIAGRIALGLRLTPTSRTTTVRYVDIDVDQQTGLPLRVAVTARGDQKPALSTDFLEVHVGRPATADTRFSPPPGATLSTQRPADFVADADRFAPFQLPGELAGLPRSQRVSTLLPSSGAATYGRGYDLLALIPLQRSLAGQIFRALRPPAGTSIDLGRGQTQAVAESLPLANVLVVATSTRSYVLSGTVTLDVLTRAADQLVDSPPPFRDGIGQQ